MKRFATRLLGLLLVLSVTGWTQTVCPMMLFPPAAKGEARHVPAAKSTGHECCHGAKSTTDTESAKMSACAPGMDCCSIERQPASSPKAPSAAPLLAVLGRLDIPPHQSDQGPLLVQDQSEGALRHVLVLKEDLRI
ncbi:MAG TPA: hypothetical protein VN577_17155 [Terriglobales bacterium]|nr:hypothetical protein [Terriglobales bacterium]